MFVIAGGASTHQSNNIQSAIETNQAIGRLVFNHGLPSYVATFSFYNLYDPCASDDETASWISETNPSPQQFQALQQALQYDNHRKAKVVDKHNAHYILLPSSNHHQSMLAWAEVGPYAIEHKPIVGFSIEEAKSSKRVTLAGPESSFPSSTLEDLRSAGCDVQRFDRLTEPENSEKNHLNAANGVPQE
jgi:hypothetical protein